MRWRPWQTKSSVADRNPFALEVCNSTMTTSCRCLPEWWSPARCRRPIPFVRTWWLYGSVWPGEPPRFDARLCEAPRQGDAGGPLRQRGNLSRRCLIRTHRLKATSERALATWTYGGCRQATATPPPLRRLAAKRRPMKPRAETTAKVLPAQRISTPAVWSPLPQRPRSPSAAIHTRSAPPRRTPACRRSPRSQSLRSPANWSLERLNRRHRRLQANRRPARRRGRSPSRAVGSRLLEPIWSAES